MVTSPPWRADPMRALFVATVTIVLMAPLVIRLVGVAMEHYKLGPFKRPSGGHRKPPGGRALRYPPAFIRRIGKRF